jgi:hypothetical protein
MATNTATNKGTRKMIRTLASPQYRNFEGTQDPTVAYNSNHSNLAWVDGNVYQPGSTLPFDVAGTSYSKKAIAWLQLFWDQEWVVPAV